MQTGQLSERQEPPGINLIAHDQPPVALQPGDRAFHLHDLCMTLMRSRALTNRPRGTAMFHALAIAVIRSLRMTKLSRALPAGDGLRGA